MEVNFETGNLLMLGGRFNPTETANFESFGPIEQPFGSKEGTRKNSIQQPAVEENKETSKLEERAVQLSEKKPQREIKREAAKEVSESIIKIGEIILAY